MTVKPITAMVRTFISVDFNNEEIVKNVVSIQQQLQIPESKIKLVNPKILHTTLEFLGEISENEIKQVSEILNEIEFPKFKITIGNPGLLPNEKHVRVIYCNMDGDIEILTDIQREIRTKLKKLRFKVDSRSFKPHLTIARVKFIHNKTELIKVINNLSEFNCGEQDIGSIKLKKSELSPSGPHYTTIIEVKAQQR